MRVNLPRRYSNPKCIYTKQQNWKTNQAKTGITERGIDKLTIIVGDINIHFSTIARHTRHITSKYIEEQ